MTIKTDKNEKTDLLALRHSAEHILQNAMEKIYPKILKVIGPATEDGFFMEFDLEEKITPEEFEKIEKIMQEIVEADLPITKHVVTKEYAETHFANNPYKLQLIRDIYERGEEISFYQVGEPGDKYFETDLCSGPHVSRTSDVGAIKLLHVSGAYWRNDSSNKMLQRIHGTAFQTNDNLVSYLDKLEEAKRRDHRKLGKELDLFVFSDVVGKGLPMFTEKGATIWRELERFTVDEEIKNGYKHVRTPALAKVDLYKKSGHYPYYADTMYPTMKCEDEELILRPMTCPHHFELYGSKIRTYKELPLRIAEISQLYRYELSGTLTGLFRARGFCLADSHNFVRKNNASEEIKMVLALIKKMVGTLGLEEGNDYVYRLSLGDSSNKEKYYDSPKEWEYAENVLRDVLKQTGASFYEAKNEAAFYGPKIDIQMFNVLGKEETAFTVQYDFCMPERFDLKYVNEKGEIEQPVVIHRSSIGAFERIIGFLIEKYAGAFPVWLAPVQVKIIPISEKHIEYATKIDLYLKSKGLRVEIDDRSETMQARIRDAQVAKVPYMLIFGDKEVQNNTVSVRLRSNENKGEMSYSDFGDLALNKYLTKALDLW